MRIPWAAGGLTGLHWHSERRVSGLDDQLDGAEGA